MRDLQKGLEICNKATPGPWHWTPEEIGRDAGTGWWGEPPSVILPQVMGDNNGKRFVVWSNDDAEFIAQAREGWPHAIERAIKAEAEVEQLKAELKKVEFWQKHYEEVTKLCRVVDAAREFFEGTGCEPKECKKCDPKYINFCERSGIGRVLAELDKEGER